MSYEDMMDELVDYAVVINEKDKRIEQLETMNTNQLGLLAQRGEVIEKQDKRIEEYEKLLDRAIEWWMRHKPQYSGVLNEIIEDMRKAREK